MLAKVKSGALLGVDAYVVEVECDVSGGLPAVCVVGLADTAIQESRERVRSAIRNSGLQFPATRITINLAPANMKKAGPCFDLPIAVGILAATEQLACDRLEKTMLVGELSLDGSLKAIRGTLSLALSAAKSGFEHLMVPRANQQEAAMVPGLNVWGVGSLEEAVGLLSGAGNRFGPAPSVLQPPLEEAPGPGLDFSDVRGQDVAKRALEVAASGGHNVLMVGSPGAGKTMLAKRLPGILPPMSQEEAMESSRIYSVVGLLPAGTPLLRQRPFRAPHHSISATALVGGSSLPRPGEISLAHHGVLFLDELPEFRRDALEILRQPLEDGTVIISRAQMSLTFPANFTLVAALNPCPCGYRGDTLQACSCTPQQADRYWSKLSGPLLDRIDLQVHVPRLTHQELTAPTRAEDSAAIRSRVIEARRRQQLRFTGTGISCNARMGSRQIRDHCALDASGNELLCAAISRLGLSARSYDRVLKMARTIADLAQSESIALMHLAEAIQYRSLDRGRG